MAQSDARFGYTAKLSRTDHDLGRPFGFTCAPGMLLPVHADILTAGDSVYIKHDLPFMRTNPLAAPAMVDVKVHFESFFVPFQLIYQASENTIFSLTEQFSSFFDPSNMRNNAFPVFNYQGYISDIKTNYLRDSIHAEAFRLADMLGLHPELFLTWTSQARCPWIDFTDGHPTGFFPWQILTYRAIYQMYYRLDDKTPFDNTKFNWDRYYNQSQPVNASLDFMTIYHRPWNFDYFSSMYWSPIVSNSNLQKVLDANSYSDLIGSNTLGITSVGNYSADNTGVRSFASDFASTFSNSQAKQGVSTSSIRQLFANEKLAMITGRARKNYDSQVLAHFGVNVPHDVKHELTLIGHDEYYLRVGEVTSLASTEDAPLGELAGKGWASSRDGREIKTHKFTAPVHGIVMTIFSVEPIRRYYGGFERQNAVYDAFDLPVPEFDRLGNVPMFRYEVGQLFTTSQSATDIVGWKERFYQFKRREPRVTFAFEQTMRGQGSNNYEAYMLGSRPFSEHFNFEVANGNSYYQWSNPQDSERFYIPFNAMDNVMLTSYGYGFCAGKEGEYYTDEDWNKNPHLIYARDPFIVDCYPHVKKISWMSKDGEPIYPY